jgi:ubiquinone/menaquinone biosynthesis C-methylase UbiE
MADAPYDTIAAWYDQTVETNSLYRDVVLPSLMSLTPDLDGRSVCDVACGQGYASRALARRGARVTGVDIAIQLLALARQYEEQEPLGIRYMQDDAEQLRQLADASFDGATCCMALMNINDLAACARAIHRVLRPGGWFVATITHPCFQTPHSDWIVAADGELIRTVRSYGTERFWSSTNPDGVRGRVGEHHRMLSTYVNTFTRVGFLLEQIDEPLATGQRAEHAPGERVVPSILSLCFRSR